MIKSATLTFSFDDFSQGLDWSGASDKVDKRSLYDAKNVVLTPYRTIEKRGGSALLTAASIGAYDVRALFEHVKVDGTRLVLAQSNTVLYYLNSTTWTSLKTGLTADAKLSFAHHRGFTFCVNGSDANFKIRDVSVTAVGGSAPTAPTAAAGAATGLTGKFRYKTTAYRSTAPTLETDGSAASSAVTVSNQKVTVSHTAHSDSQFDKLRIYRTFDETTGDTNDWFLVATVTNATTTYTDNTADASLGAAIPETHAKPPAAKFCVLHKNRMIYANCPSLEDGSSVFIFSEVGEPEYAPLTNYQYFDRSDGDEITGVASLPDYLLVFKKNKIAVMEGDFQQWYTLSPSTGCIAPWAIISFVDKVMFMGEEGWKITDGRAIYDVSKKLTSILQAGAITWPNKLEYSGVYYPNKKQTLFLLANQSRVMAGHALTSLYQDVSREDTVDEPYIGWTYFEYPSPSMVLTTLGMYTDSLGISRVIAGTADGYVYILDTGTADGDAEIPFIIETGWTVLTDPTYKPVRDFTALTKKLRMINVVYSSGTTEERAIAIDVDYARDVDSITLTQGASSYVGEHAYSGVMYCGGEGLYTQNIALGAICTGRTFRFRITGEDSYVFGLRELNLRFRISGLREGVN